MSDSVDRNDIVNGLKKLGLRAGDMAFVHSSLSSFGHVFVHSSLSSFGHVVGGAKAVVRAFLDVLGPGGTLAVPIFRRYFWGGPDQVWDRDNSPSLMGRISETVRTWPGARKSHHAPHPIAAVGNLAEDLTERYNITDFGPDSPFSRMEELNAWIVLVGVNYNSCTMIHLAEESMEVPYRRWVELTGTVIDGGIPARKTYRFLARYPGVSNDFMPLGNRLESEGLVKIGVIGKSTIRCFRSQDLHNCALRSLRDDTLFLISSDTKEEARKYISN